jgi:hypothetical protein
MNDGWCLECGEEFHFDDTGGYNPPCYCKACAGAVCRSCHPRERLAEHARDIAETLVEAEDWSGTERGDAAWKRIASLLAQPLAPRSEPSLVERAIEIAQEKVGFRSDVSMHDYGGHSVPDGVHRADCRWCAIVRDARGAVDS